MEDHASYKLGIIDAYKAIHNIKQITSDHAEVLAKLLNELEEKRYPSVCPSATNGE